jgi:type IV secretory pathway VirJ component
VENGKPLADLISLEERAEFVFRLNDWKNDGGSVDDVVDALINLIDARVQLGRKP